MIRHHFQCWLVVNHGHFHLALSLYMLSPVLFDYHVSTDIGKTAWLTKKKEFENICTISFINPPPPPPHPLPNTVD